MTEVSSFQTYIRLLKYLRHYKRPLALSVIGFAIFALSQPLLAKLMEHVVAAIQAKDFASRWTLPFYAVGVFFIRGVGSFLGDYYNDYVGANIVARLKQDIFDRLTVLPATYYDTHSQGQILHRLTNGATRVQAIVTDAIKTLISEGLTVVALVAYVFYMNWKLSAIFLIFAPMMLLVVRYTTKRFKSISRRNEGAMGVAMQVSKELVSNYSIVRAFGAQAFEKARYGRALATALRQQMKIRKISAIAGPTLQLITAIAIAGVVFLLLQPAVLEAHSASELIGYLTAVALLPKPMRQLSRVNMVIQQGLVGADLIFRILDAPAEADTGTYTVDRVAGEIRFDGVSFQYPTSKKYVLDNISLTIRAGEMVALVGKSGSGKSTLASLIYRQHDATSGSIFLDGVEIKDFALTNLRQQVAVVNQHVALFDDTIRNNIAYGNSNYSDEQIEEAARRAHAMEFIEQQPKRLDMLVGDNGLKLSGGQRQRIAIARAFLKDSPILILDEATSALDNASEAVIKAAIETVLKNRTALVIAHRLSTIEKADRLVVMDEGRIVEQGTHAELLAKNGYYANLLRSEYSPSRESVADEE